MEGDKEVTVFAHAALGEEDIEVQTLQKG